MRQWKKAAVVLLCIGMLGALSGCGDKADNGDYMNGATSGEDSTKRNDNGKVGDDLENMADDAGDAIEDGVRDVGEGVEDMTDNVKDDMTDNADNRTNHVAE